MQIIKDIQQQTPEWFKLREKRMTASHACAIGNAGAGLETYIYDLMADYYSNAEKINYSNTDTERGNIREPQAKFLYENETGQQVEDVCFIIKNDFIGCSPDGLVGDKGLVEFKAPNDTNYFKLLLDYKIKSEYYWQCQMQLEITGREWVDFVNYNPNFDKKLLIKRIYPDKEYFAKLQVGYAKGTELIKEIIKKYENQI